MNYGCGYDKRSGYLNVDMDPACAPDFLIKDLDLSALPQLHFEEVLAKDVLEHIPRNKSLAALLDFSSFLVTNGRLIVQTSSILHVAKHLENNPSFDSQFGWTICMFGNQAHPGDFHYTGFTETTLKVHLAAAGFEVIEQSLVEEWVFNFVCEKVFSWDELLTKSLSNEGFLSEAYQIFFNRPLDEQGRIYFLKCLETQPRRHVLREIASCPERLYVTARNLGL